MSNLTTEAALLPSRRWIPGCQFGTVLDVKIIGNLVPSPELQVASLLKGKLVSMTEPFPVLHHHYDEHLEENPSHTASSQILSSFE